MKPIHSGRLERWLGKERVEYLSQSMRGWYGKPIAVLDLPGGVKITGDGDFVGTFNRGYFMSAMDSLEVALKCAARAPHGQLNAGFSSISDALSRASQGFSQRVPFNKVGPTGVAAVTSSLWFLGPQPAVGTHPATAPGGTAFSNATVGSLQFANPAAGTNRLVGADVSASVINNSLLLYDLLFGVTKASNSTAAQAVTGVPTRYQSTTATAEDYIGDNFGFVQVGTVALPATAHNWTVCTYLDQANAASTLPSLTGNASAITHRFDHPVQQWFAPLESGDSGMKAWTQIQCSALVATGDIKFMIGHPLGFMSFPVINSVLPFDWLTNRDQAPRVFANACLAFLEPLKPATTTTTYTGRIVTTSTSA